MQKHSINKLDADYQYNTTDKNNFFTILKR